MIFTNPQKCIFILFILFSSLCSPAIFATSLPQVTPIQTIDGGTVKLEQFDMGYFVDTTENMAFDGVRKQNFQVAPNALSLGSESKTTWSKIKLYNANDTSKTIYLHNPYAYHNSLIAVYEVADDKVLHTRLLNMDNKETQQWMYRGSAVFDINLPPQQEITLYVKNVAFSHQWFALNLYDENNSKRILIGKYTDIALAVGMLLALIIYNFLLFFTSRLKEHLYYACYLVAGGIWIALSYGLFADLFNIYGTITLKWHLSLTVMPIFLLLFMINIFDTKKNFPIEHWALLSVLTLLILNLFYGLFDILTALHYSSSLAALMMLVSLSVTLSMLIRKQPIAFLFLLGHGLFVFFSALAVLFYKGKTEFTYINSHGVGIGILLEALVLSLIIAYRIKILESLKAAQADLQLLASTDPLTQLFNRRHFNNVSSKLLKHTKLTQQVSSVALIDIDNFKKINDTYGHTTGDKAIKQVADIIKAKSRHQDVVARYGGEEFIILMPSTQVNDAYKLTERIRAALENTTIAFEEIKLNFTISAGIAEIDIQHPNLQTTINQADKALYQAKNNGKNQSQLFSD